MASSTVDLGTAHWRKSSHSNGDGGYCVEVAAPLPALPDAVPVRDSKRAEDGPVLLFSTPAWAPFLASLKH
ncbi:DUF397 domain-containing protein [Streptomyces sp. NPDC007264]|uniref:DUF397 domain-containing protein n=1 Tax=Streptomyces sp. NPDC007264 TaxID=3364777 RepID=UPI0036D9438D